MHRDVPYLAPAAADVSAKQHCVDIYVPPGPAGNAMSARGYPVLIHVHGGGWKLGSTLQIKHYSRIYL